MSEEQAISGQVSAGTQKVQEALDAHGLVCEVLEFPSGTRTALDAARAVGCEVGQIVKSLIFKGKHSQRPIFVVASGANRVNEKKLGEIVDEPITKADADFVRERTGFAIGGVPPVGHVQRLEAFIDEDLMQYEEIWAAAGTPRTVFKLTPKDLERITGGRIISIK